MMLVSILLSITSILASIEGLQFNQTEVILNQDLRMNSFDLNEGFGVGKMFIVHGVVTNDTKQMIFELLNADKKVAFVMIIMFPKKRVLFEEGGSSTISYSPDNKAYHEIFSSGDNIKVVIFFDHLFYISLNDAFLARFHLTEESNLGDYSTHGYLRIGGDMIVQSVLYKDVDRNFELKTDLLSERDCSSNIELPMSTHNLTVALPYIFVPGKSLIVYGITFVGSADFYIYFGVNSSFTIEIYVKYTHLTGVLMYISVGNVTDSWRLSNLLNGEKFIIEFSNKDREIEVVTNGVQTASFPKPKLPVEYVTIGGNVNIHGLCYIEQKSLQFKQTEVILNQDSQRRDILFNAHRCRKNLIGVGKIMIVHGVLTNDTKRMIFKVLNANHKVEFQMSVMFPEEMIHLEEETSRGYLFPRGNKTFDNLFSSGDNVTLFIVHESRVFYVLLNDAYFARFDASKSTSFGGNLTRVHLKIDSDMIVQSVVYKDVHYNFELKPDLLLAKDCSSNMNVPWSTHDLQVVLPSSFVSGNNLTVYGYMPDEMSNFSIYFEYNEYERFIIYFPIESKETTISIYIGNNTYVASNTSISPGDKFIIEFINKDREIEMVVNGIQSTSFPKPTVMVHAKYVWLQGPARINGVCYRELINDIPI